jgi:hypothetical protein
VKERALVFNRKHAVRQRAKLAAYERKELGREEAAAKNEAKSDEAERKRVARWKSYRKETEEKNRAGQLEHRERAELLVGEAATKRKKQAMAMAAALRLAEEMQAEHFAKHVASLEGQAAERAQRLAAALKKAAADVSRVEKTKEEKLLKKEAAVEVAVARQVDKVRLETALMTEASKLRFDGKKKLSPEGGAVPRCTMLERACQAASLTHS